MSSIRYHVLESMEEWLSIDCHEVETVLLHEPKVPRFEFTIKVVIGPNKRRDLYIPSCAISALKEIKNYIKMNNIVYKPTNHIKFAFDYVDTVHCYKLSDAPKPKRRYPQPVDFHVALAVVTQLFDTRDVLGGVNEELLIYYYLSVLRAVNHPIINQALLVVNGCKDDQNLYDSALVPKCESQNYKLKYYSLYADLIYFLSLMAPPICVGDTVHSITFKVQRRHEEQLKILCDSVGISNYEIISRGEGWQKLMKFFEANPVIGHVIAASILKPPEIESPLTVIEKQVMCQLKQLWQWTGLYNFRDCYKFAVNGNTEAHCIPVIIDQCEYVKSLQQKLKVTVGSNNLIPFAKLLVDEEKFFDQYDVQKYPDLFYATRSYMTKEKKGNAMWEEFVATRSVTIPRQEIDEKLRLCLAEGTRGQETKESGKIEMSNFNDKLVAEVEAGLESLHLQQLQKEEDSVSFESEHFVYLASSEDEDRIGLMGDISRKLSSDYIMVPLT